MENELLRIAKDDLKSSKQLYSIKQYRNAVYLFQQASEKTTKAIGLMLGHITDERKLKKVGHESEKIFLQMLDKTINDTKALLKRTDQINHILTDDMKLDYHRMVSYFEFNEYNKLFGIEPLKKYSLQELNDVITFLDTIKPNNKASRVTLATIDGNEGSDADIISFITSLNNVSNTEPGEEEDTKLIKFLIDNFIPIVFHMIYPFYVSFIFSIMMKGHVANTRYPNTNSSPTSYYTLRLPLVKKLPLLIKYLQDAISILERTTEDLNNLSYD